MRALVAEGYVKDAKGRMRWVKVHGQRGNSGAQMWEKLFRRHSNLDQFSLPYKMTP